ncbi:MAG: hypothetical protein SGJ13_16295 [Actinomycetota bacterium]|nr:hypothetical protein [Actinomycetota bacterium]
MQRVLVLAMVAVAAVAGCSGDDNDGAAPSTTFAPSDASDWDPAALATAEGLADQLRAGDIACDTYEAFNFPLIADDYEGRLPVPDAMSECISNGENLTFEIFLDDDGAASFTEAKITSICKGVTQRSIPFEGLSYVRGDGWIITPDTEATADAIAEVLDAEAHLETCD